MLTAKQSKLLSFIARHITRKGYAPSFDDMAGALGKASKSGIHAMLVRLEQRGYIRRLPYKARAVEVIRKPKQRRTA